MDLFWLSVFAACLKDLMSLLFTVVRHWLQSAPSWWPSSGACRAGPSHDPGSTRYQLSFQASRVRGRCVESWSCWNVATVTIRLSGKTIVRQFYTACFYPSYWFFNLFNTAVHDHPSSYGLTAINFTAPYMLTRSLWLIEVVHCN